MKNLPSGRRKWAQVRVGLLGVLLLTFAALVWRRAHVLQVERAPALREMAEEQYLRQVRLAPKRGTIYDRHGAELAVSVDVDSVWANPRHMKAEGVDPAQAAAQLSQLLGVDRERIQRRLESDRLFVWIKRRLTPRMADRVRALGIEGVHLDQEARRYYPNRRLASHLLGFANIDGQGIEGLELSFEDELRGSSRAVPAIRDRRGRVVFSEQLLDDRAAQGDSLVLTLDKTLQYVAERELELALRTYEAQAGSVVMMDPHTGELLAVANYPDFDPNRPGSSPMSHRRNRAFTDRFEPGSTVKPFTVAAALAAGTIGSQQRIDCQGGAMEVAEYTIHDTTPYDELTPAQILAFSSNIGTATIGTTLGRRGLYRAFRRFGFGAESGVPVPGEASGSLRHFRDWYEMDAATISFGQGMSTTAVQLAAAMSALANGGRLMRPILVRRVESSQRETLREWLPEARRQVVPPRVARLVSDMLTAVTGPGGTAPQAGIDGFLVAGKTGTAQKADSVAGGYADDRWLASFVGFVPAERPRLVMAVVVDEPVVAHYGGVVAGPVFRRIGEAALRHLGVPSEGGGEALEQHAREQRRRRRLARRASAEASDTAPEADVASDDAVGSVAAGQVRVPSFAGSTARAALVAAHQASLTLKFSGSGLVAAQRPRAGEAVEQGSPVEVVLHDERGASSDSGAPELLSNGPAALRLSAALGPATRRGGSAETARSSSRGGDSP